MHKQKTTAKHPVYELSSSTVPLEYMSLNKWKQLFPFRVDKTLIERRPLRSEYGCK